jgi:predicted CoA-binding protein
MDEGLIRAFLKKKNAFAVVGASRDPRKYGYQMYKDLKNAGYEVYPVNPKAQKILGDKCYPSLENLSIKPDVADVVVPPKVTEQVVETCKKLNRKSLDATRLRIWGCNQILRRKRYPYRAQNVGND